MGCIAASGYLKKIRLDPFKVFDHSERLDKPCDQFEFKALAIEYSNLADPKSQDRFMVRARKQNGESIASLVRSFSRVTADTETIPVRAKVQQNPMTLLIGEATDFREARGD